jgi:rubrerythrin
MISPGELRLVAWLYENSKDVDPTINEDSTVVYSTASKIVDARDRPVSGTLDSLAKRCVLEKELTRKGYICPSCSLEGMRYSRACPECGSVHTTGRVVANHPDCGHSGPADEFEQKDGQRYCHGCDTAIDQTELEYDQRHVCRDCGTAFSRPQHQVQCRICLETYLPEQVTERLFYSYRLTDHGRAWYQIQMMTREQARTQFEERGYATEIDIEISNGSEPCAVNVFAEHTMLNKRVIANIYDEVETADLDYLWECAELGAAHPAVISTDRHVPSEILNEIRDRSMGLLTVQHDGTLGLEYDSREETSALSILNCGV